MKRVATVMCLIFLFATLSAYAQMPMPKPAPELKKLDYFLGTWTLEGDMQPGPMGPGGKMTETERTKWMDGGFFLISHIDFKSAGMGNGTGISFLGYNANDKVYTYDAFNSMGEAEHAKGTLDGDTWTYTAEEKMGGKTMNGRFTIKQLTPTSYSFKFEMAPPGGDFTTVMDGKATKK
jgi:hypothetical protein